MVRSFGFFIVMVFIYMSAFGQVEPFGIPASPEEMDPTYLSNLETLGKNEALILKTHSEVVAWLEAMNLANTSAVIECFCLVKGLKNCQSDKTEFSYHFLSASGKFRDRVMSCEKAVSQFVSERLPIDIIEMRMSLALAGSDFLTDQFTLFLKNKLSLREIVKVHPSHPVKFSGVGSEIEPLGKDEQQKAVVEISKLKQNICKSYLEKNLDKARKTFEAKTMYDLCNQIIFVGDLYNNSVSRDIDPIASQELNRSYIDFARYYRNEFQKEHLKKYFEVVDRNPLVLFIQTAKPSDDEIYQALVLVRKNAEKRIAEEKKIGAAWFEKEKWALPYTTSLLRARTPGVDLNAYDDASQSLLKRGRLINGTKDFAIGAVAIAGFFACNVIPAGKSLKLFSIIVARGSCHLAYGLSANSFFLIDGFIKQQELMNRFLSVIERNQKSVTIEELMSAKMQVWLAIALFPTAALLPR